VDDLVSRVLSGEIRALARVCRFIDDQRPGYRELCRQLFPHAQAAWVVGITGSPGAGKSTLTDALVSEFRGRGLRVGVVAVDPTSPFTGGAFLGDRIRLQRHFQDPQVFIRSLATRGALGGLSRTTQDTVVAVAAWRADVVLVETVGVGQDEVDVARAADATCVVVAPGMGDDIQATKAGILESADVFVVNKADRDGADASVRDLEMMLALGASLVPATSFGGHGVRTGLAGPPDPSWVPPIIRSVATAGQGVSELIAELDRHRELMEQSGKARQRRRRRDELMLLRMLQERWMQGFSLTLGSELNAALDRIGLGELDPYSALDLFGERFAPLGAE
jgi:LAO/AO transport system kinase